MTAMAILSGLLLASIYICQVTSLNETEVVQGYDCSDIWERNRFADSGIYLIKPKNAAHPFQVFCEMFENGGWTLLQKHDGTDGLSFTKSWSDYESGFGNLQGEHWLGLQNIFALTHQSGRSSKLHIRIGDFNGDEAYAEYNPFRVGSASNYYKLLAGGYSGTAGDAFFGDEEINGSMQHGSLFSTKDVVKDNCHPECEHGDMMFPSCSERFQAGWWYNACGLSNLNGIWRAPPRHRHRTSSLTWPTWRPDESLKYSKMYLINK